jgi:hypothetical protein
LPGSRAGRGSSSSSASSACEHARLLGLGLGGLDHLGHELLLAQLGLALGQLSLSRDHFALRAGLRQRAGLRGLGLGLVDLGLVLGLDDRGLALVLGLLALGLLLGLGRRLIGLGLGDLGLALDAALWGAAIASMYPARALYTSTCVLEPTAARTTRGTPRCLPAS